MGVVSVAPETMYVYEGKDYSRASKSDRRSFDQLLTGTVQGTMYII